MTRRKGDAPEDITADLVVDDAPAAPIAAVNPAEGGCYVRQPDGSLVREEDA